ncbi:MAG TPA: GGDEF domain-containing protein, partial [Candidatus Paenibacillus intestinavium]|nr:GGDEF domain-containing protein [Candidatus Paenibacillus intestinavium]
MMDGTIELNKPIIWFTDEDFHDADEPYLPELLTESYNSWYADAGDMKLCLSGIFRLYTKMGHNIGNHSELSLPVSMLQLDTQMSRAAELCLKQGQFIQFNYENIQYSAILIKRRRDSVAFAAFVYATKVEQAITDISLEAYMKHFRTHFYRVFESVFVKEIMIQKTLIEKEASHRERLFLISKRLYDQISAESVVREVLSSLEDLYQDSEIYLYLSQDHLEGDARIRPLEFRNSANDIVTEAFLEGRCCIDREQDGYIKLAIPMNGKQAAYGVLCIEIKDFHWDESDLPAFMLIADTAGSAFE